jgi:hypothetical protein
VNRLVLAWLLACGCAAAHAPAVQTARPDPSDILATVLLIGDAGAPVADDPVLAALGREIDRDPEATTVVFLGDNIYPRGMPDSANGARADAERRIDAQSDAAAAAARVVFLPGNHDWDRGADDGWNRIRNQARHLVRRGSARVLPEDGCPGPVTIDPGPGLRIVLLDTQWWLHGGSRPGPGSSCVAATPDAVERATADAIRTADERAVIVAGHHPLVSTGPHGGRFGWTDHVFPLRALAGWAWIPLPVIGSAYPIARMSGATRQDQSSSIYRAFRDALVGVFTQATPLVYVSGHEHALEVRHGPGAEYTLVSGGGSTGDYSTLRPDPGETLFSLSANGFMRVDALEDGRVRLTVIAVNIDDGTSVDTWGTWLR